MREAEIENVRDATSIDKVRHEYRTTRQREKQFENVGDDGRIVLYRRLNVFQKYSKDRFLCVQIIRLKINPR